MRNKVVLVNYKNNQIINNKIKIYNNMEEILKIMNNELLFRFKPNKYINK